MPDLLTPAEHRLMDLTVELVHGFRDILGDGRSSAGDMHEFVITVSSHHSVGLFLDLLAAEGYRVTPIDAPALADLLPPAAD